MTLVTRSSSASSDASNAIILPQISGDIIAGEDMGIGPCYLKASDGKAWKSSGAAAGAEAAKVHGWNPRPNVKAGQPVTLLGPGARFRYSTSMTPGAKLYLSPATAGLLDTAPSAGDPIGVATVINATDIRADAGFGGIGGGVGGGEIVVIGGTQSITSATLANLTGIGIALAAGTYDIDFMTSFLSAATTVGLTIGAVVSAGFSRATIQVNIPTDDPIASVSGSIVASGGSVGATDAPATKMLATARGVLVLSAAGTLQMQAARETDAGSIAIAIDYSQLSVRKRA